MSTDAIRFTAVTPNLIVRDIAASTRFYTEVLGFTIKQTVPDAAPFVFVWLERGAVTVFLNDAAAVAHDIPAYASPAFGGTAALFVAVEGVDALHAAVAPHARLRRAQRAQRVERVLAAAFLEDHQADREQGEGAQQQAFAQVAEHEIQRRGHQQQQEHGLGGDAPERAHPALALAVAELVGAVQRQAPLRLVAAQTCGAPCVRHGGQSRRGRPARD